MEILGFKNLTQTNWLHPDDVVLLFKRLSSGDGTIHDVSGEEWAREFLGPHLIPEVPHEVRKLFEVARGSMIYGFFFYPLYALGVEQLARVAEASLTAKCQQSGAPKSAHSFQEKTVCLCKAHIISEKERPAWDAMREFRNEVFHPKDQNILPPAVGVRVLQDIASRINHLFSVVQA